jgi:hypothetical protein
MALAEIDRVVAAGVRFGCVLADSGYGLSAPFRQGLTARKLTWAVGIARHHKVYPADVQMIWPVAKRGRPHQRHVPNILSIPAEDMMARAKWHTPARKESSRLVLLRSACGSPTAPRSGSGTRVNNICPRKRPGSSVNTGCSPTPSSNIAGSQQQGGEKKNQRAAASTDLASRAPGHPRTHRSATAATMPALPKMDLQQAAA